MAYTLQDLINTAVVLQSLRSDLTDMMVELCDEWIDEVKLLIKKERDKIPVEQSEIDAMVEWHNEICHEEAYPPLLPINKSDE